MRDGTERLAIFLPALGGGGAQRAAVNLAQGIAASGHDVDLVLARDAEAFEVPPQNGLRLVRFGTEHVLGSALKLALYLRRERPASMLSVMNHANIVAVWARSIAGTSTRLVLNEQNTFSQELENDGKLRARFVPGLVRRTYPRADRIVAVSRGAAEDLARVTGLPRHRIDILYNPVVTPELKETCRRDVSHQWLQPGSPPVVLSVGRLCEQKDFPTLLRAFAVVRKRRAARLMILGEGPDRAGLEGLADELGIQEDVALPGWVHGPAAYMARAAAFVLSSRYEGLPTVLIEALYAGVPVVATDCPSGPREILKDGRWGHLVPIGDVDALAHGIDHAISGRSIHPPPESWREYELERVVSRYLALLLDS